VTYDVTAVAVTVTAEHVEEPEEEVVVLLLVELWEPVNEVVAMQLQALLSLEIELEHAEK
jgi:hypothetical protein